MGADVLEAGILDGQSQLKLDGKVVTSKGKVRCAPGPDARPSPAPKGPPEGFILRPFAAVPCEWRGCGV